MRRLAIALVLVIAAPLTVAAQKLTPGTWTGTVTAPDAGEVSATFDVRVSGDTTSITLKGEFGEFPLADVKVSEDRLTFTFSPGTMVRCTLMLRQDKSYSGDCLDDEGGKGVMVMNPPKPGSPAP